MFRTNESGKITFQKMRLEYKKKGALEFPVIIKEFKIRHK